MLFILCAVRTTSVETPFALFILHGFVILVQYVGVADDQAQRVLEVVGYRVGKGIHLGVACLKLKRLLAQRLFRSLAFGDFLLRSFVQPRVHNRSRGGCGQRLDQAQVSRLEAVGLRMRRPGARRSRLV